MRHDDAALSLDTLACVIPGLVVGIFDRSCVYTMVYGGFVADLAIGRKVGALNPESGEILFELARRTIATGERHQTMVQFRTKLLEVRMVPVVQPLYGIVGGILSAWDASANVGKLA